MFLKRALVLAALSLTACGGMEGVDAGLPGPADSGVPVRDAGLPDAGLTPFDAGPPPRTVFGTMTVNGAQHELTGGYGSGSSSVHTLRVVSTETLEPRFQVTMLVPEDAGAAFQGICGVTPLVLFGAQHITDAGIAFFTVDAGCTIGLTQVARQVDEDYVGTFSGVAEFEPRSRLDAGYGVMTITNGSFRIRRTF